MEQRCGPLGPDWGPLTTLQVTTLLVTNWQNKRNFQRNMKKKKGVERERGEGRWRSRKKHTSPVFRCPVSNSVIMYNCRMVCGSLGRKSTADKHLISASSWCGILLMTTRTHLLVLIGRTVLTMLSISQNAPSILSRKGTGTWRQIKVGYTSWFSETVVPPCRGRGRGRGPGLVKLFIIGAQVHFSIRNFRIRVHFNRRFMWGLPRTVSIRAIFSSFIFYYYDFIFLIIVSVAVNGLGFDPDAPPSPRTIFSACSFATCKKFWVIFLALGITNTQSEFVPSREFVIYCFFNQVLSFFAHVNCLYWSAEFVFLEF